MQSPTDEGAADPPPEKIQYKFSDLEEIAPGVFSFSMTVTAPKEAEHYLAGIRMVLQQEFGGMSPNPVNPPGEN